MKWGEEKGCDEYLTGENLRIVGFLPQLLLRLLQQLSDPLLPKMWVSLVIR